MENIQMKTGLDINIPSEPSDNVKTFMLCFTAIIWRRVWITTAIYCEHNKINLSNSVVLKALKYNVLSDVGIGNTLRPYIAIALKDGFIMPQCYKKNLYATRAVLMFKDAYEVIKKKDREEEIKYISRYAMSVFQSDKESVKDVANETKDTKNIKAGNSDITNPSTTNFGDSNFSSDSTFSSDSGDSEDNNESPEIDSPCDCKMCQLVNSWDIDLSLGLSEDPYQNVVMNGLMAVLNQGLSI